MHTAQKRVGSSTFTEVSGWQVQKEAVPEESAAYFLHLSILPVHVQGGVCVLFPFHVSMCPYPFQIYLEQCKMEYRLPDRNGTGNGKNICQTTDHSRPCILTALPGSQNNWRCRSWWNLDARVIRQSPRHFRAQWGRMISISRLRKRLRTEKCIGRGRCVPLVSIKRGCCWN